MNIGFSDGTRLESAEMEFTKNDVGLTELVLTGQNGKDQDRLEGLANGMPGFELAAWFDDKGRCHIGHRQKTVASQQAQETDYAKYVNMPDSELETLAVENGVFDKRLSKRNQAIKVAEAISKKK